MRRPSALVARSAPRAGADRLRRSARRRTGRGGADVRQRHARRTRWRSTHWAPSRASRRATSSRASWTRCRRRRSARTWRASSWSSRPRTCGLPDETIVYDDRVASPTESRGRDNLVDVTLGGADRIDERGSWQGAVADGELQFTVDPGGRRLPDRRATRRPDSPAGAGTRSGSGRSRSTSSTRLPGARPGPGVRAAGGRPGLDPGPAADRGSGARTWPATPATFSRRAPTRTSRSRCRTPAWPRSTSGARRPCQVSPTGAC